jgi:hypothetical protein
MLETFRDPKFLLNWIKSASRWFHYTGLFPHLINALQVTKESLQTKYKRKASFYLSISITLWSRKKNVNKAFAFWMLAQRKISVTSRFALFILVKFVGSHWRRRLNGLASQCGHVYGKDRRLALLGMKLTHPTRTFMISNFRLVLNVVCFLLDDSPAAVVYMPTFRNTVCSIFIPTRLWRWNRQSVPKHWHSNSRRQWIIQKKAYNNP